MFKRRYIVVALLVLIFIGIGLSTSDIVFLKNPESESVSFISDTETYEDDFVKIVAPKEITDSGYTYNNITIKQLPVGETKVDLAYGFNTKYIKPTSAEVYMPHWEYFNTDSTHTFYDVTIIENEPSEPCDYGNEYNTHKYKISHVINNNTYTSIVGFDSQENDGTNYIVTWHTINEKWCEWKDLTGHFESIPEAIHNNYDGKNKWYVARGLPVELGKEYQVRIWIDEIPTLKAESYKYDIALKPHSEGLQESITKGHFYMLDPWYNTSQMSRFLFVFNSSTNVAPYQIELSYHDLDLTAEMWGRMGGSANRLYFVDKDNTKTYEYYNNHTTGQTNYSWWINITDSGTDRLWVYVEDGTGMSDLSDGNKTFPLYDNFDVLDTGVWELKAGSPTITDGVICISGINEEIRTYEYFKPDKIAYSSANINTGNSWTTFGFSDYAGRNFRMYSDNAGTLMFLYDTTSSTPVTNWGDSTWGVKTIHWHDSQNLARWTDNLVESQNSPHEVASDIPDNSQFFMIMSDNNINIYVDWIFIANTSDIRPTLATIGGGQYYATALYYNATTVYNNTRYGNYNVVAPMPYNSNCINHTFGTLGTQSNIKVNSWDNGTSPYLNFTVSGDTLDTMNVSNLTAGASYNLIANNGTTVQTVAAGDNGIVAFTSDMSAKTWTVEEAILSYPPPNPTNLQNTKGNFYVNYTWDKGAGGNITNSWNVSVNGTWVNETTEDWNNSVVGFHGTSTIIVFAYNSSGDGNRSKGYVTDSVTVDNNNPVLTNLTNIIKQEGETVYFYADATDLESDGVNFTCDRQDLFTFNSVTGTGSWDTSYADNGTYNIDIGVHDTYGGTDNQTLKIDIYKNTTFVTNISTIKDTYVYEFAQNTNYDGLTYLYGGRAAGLPGRQRYIFIQFDLSTIPTNATVIGAIFNIHQFTTDAATSILHNYRITSSWDETTVVWNTKPSHTTTNDSDTLITLSGAKGWHQLGMLDTVRGWENSSYNNYGLSLWNTTTTTISPGFNASEGLYGKEAHLFIVYTVPTSRNIADTITITDKIKLTKDAATKPQDTITITDKIAWDKTVASVSYSIDKADTITITDKIKLTKDTCFDIADTITFTDKIALAKYADFDVQETITITDKIKTTKIVTNNPPMILFVTPPTPVDLSTNYTGTIQINTSVSDVDVTNDLTAFVKWDDSLLGWWPLNNESMVDLSGNDNNGTFQGNNSNNWTDGKFGGGATLSRVNESFIDFGNDSSLKSDAAFSIEVWIKPAINQEFCYDAGLGYGNAGVAAMVDDYWTSSEWAWQLRYGSPDNCTLGLQVNTLAGSKWGTVGFNLTTVKYNHVVATFNNTTIKMYVNKTLVNETTYAETSMRDFNGLMLLLGAEGWGVSNTFYTGDADEVKYWGRVISHDEVNASYDARVDDLNITYSGLSDGTYNFTAYVQDSYGEINYTETRMVTVILPVYYDTNISDTITITDKIKLTKSSITHPQDTITFTDKIKLTKSAITKPQDTITFTDKIAFTKYSEFDIADTITFTDKIKLTKLVKIDKADTITFTDKIALTKTSGFDVADTITITDKIKLTKYSGFDVQDTITITDKISFTKFVKIDKADTITFTDKIKLTKYAGFDVQDSITITDKIKLTKYAGFDVQETITITDNISITKYAGFDVQDTITFTDKIALFKSSGTYPQDTITFTDKIKLSKSSGTHPQDTITITDKIKLIKYVKIDKADTITITDDIAHTKYAGFDVTDTITVTDNIAIEKIVTIAMELLSMTPTEIYQNSTGYLNLSYGVTHSTSGLNTTSIAFVYRNYDHDEGDSNHSIRPPNNSIAADWNLDGRILRGANRNETLNFESNDTITRGDTFSWSGLDYDNVRLTLVPKNSTYSYIYINATVHDVMPQMWYIDRTDMQEAPKTQMAINHNQDLLIKFWDYEIFKGNTDFLGVGYTDTALSSNPALWPLDGNPCEFYYLNDSYDPITGGDPLTSGYAVYMGSLNASGWIDHVYEPCCTASYVRGFIDNNLLELVTDTSEIAYIYYRSNTPPSKSFYINVTDVATGSNVSFADTGVLWAGDTAPYTAQPYTPNMWFAFMKPNITFDHQMWVADNDGNWVNTTINSTEILTSYFPPTKPTINHFHINGATDYDMNKCYNGTIKVGVAVASDPDGDWVTHNLSLHYANGTYVATINNTFTNENISHNGVFVDVNFTTVPYYSDTVEYTMRVIATDNEGKSDRSWLGKNFTLSITPRVYYYDPETPYTSIYNESVTFSVGFTQDGNITWYLDGTNVSNFTNVNYSTYTNNTASLGLHNLTAIIINDNGTRSHTWAWSVVEVEKIPLSLFILLSCVILSTFYISFTELGIFAIFNSFVGMVLSYLSSKWILNSMVVRYFGEVSTMDSIVVGSATIEIPFLGYLYIIVGTILFMNMVMHIYKEYQAHMEEVLDDY